MGVSTNLVTVHDLVIEPGRSQYLILEFVRGGTLGQRLAGGPLPLNDALRLAADLARGLQAAHDAGIVHRDVKPANIFLATDGHAQLGDFGIAQIDDVSGRTQSMVRHPGTPLYMSPEQAQTTGYVRPASDQYSLGLVLFEMVTGQAYKRIGERAAAALLETAPTAVINLIEDMIATHPDDRLPSCDHVVRQVQAITRQLGLTETQLPAPPPARAGERAASHPPGLPADAGSSSTGARAWAPPDSASTTYSATNGMRQVASLIASPGVVANAPPGTLPPSGTVPLEAVPPPLPPSSANDGPPPGRSGRRFGVFAAVVAVLLLAVVGVVAFALRGGGTTVSVTATPQPVGATGVTVATVAAAPTSQPTATVVAIVAATTVSTPTSVPTVIAAVAPTSPPTSPATAIPATATPTSKIAVFSAGTTNANLDKVNGDDVVTAFTTGQDVYGFANFGGALVGKDVIEVVLVANGTPQTPQSFTLQKSDGFLVFPLGKLGAGDYRLEVRYNGKVAQAADFRVSAPVIRVPTATPRPNVPIVPTATYAPAQPTAAQATSVPPTAAQPTVAPAATAAPVGNATPKPYIPPTQLPPKP